MRDSIYQFFMDNALEMMFMFGEDSQITYANEAAQKLLEYEEDLCRYSICDIFPGTFHLEGDKLQAECELGQEILDMTAYRRNKTCFPVKVKVLPYCDIPKIYLCVAYDDSRQNFLEKRANQAEQEVKAALKVKSEFVANVTHELRTPVNGILGNTRELLGKETEPEKLKLLKLVERSCNDMHAIINNILDFSKLEAGKFTLEQRKFNFRDMIDYVKSNHINKITEKGLEFFVTISPEVPEYIVGDELRIVQILNNLLSNACKFTSVGKIVVEVVKTSQIGNRMELFFLVIDSGIGIDKAGRDKLFQSFSQVDASISRKYGGTGLGLNICKQLVELMDGNIHVESTPNKGSMFSFHIWVEVPKEDMNETVEAGESKTIDYMDIVGQKMKSLSGGEQEEDILNYGTAENQVELNKKMSKLILSVEMENWEKAEMFAETIKQLTEGAPREVNRLRCV